MVNDEYQACDTAWHDSYKSAAPRSKAREWCATQRILANVLVNPGAVFLGTENEVKLGDFGLSKQLGPEQHLATTFLGSPSYMSPELITDKPYTLKSDIWSLGCIMYELCALNVPFPARDQVQLFSKIKSGRYSPIPSQYSPELRQVIDMCLQMDPYRRPDTAALLEHHMFRIARREREVIQLTRAVKLREEKARRHEQMLLVKQDEILKEWETRNIQMYSKIDEELKAQWEIRAHAEIRRQVDVEIQTRLKAEVEQQVQFEVERRIRELDLVPRASNHSSLNGSGSSGASSSMDSVPPPYTSQLQTPYLKRIQQTSIPDSPADITMRSPSLNGTPGNQRSPIVDMHTIGEMLPPAPVTPSRTNGGNLGGYFEQMEESPTPPTFQKPPTFVSAGPIKKTLGTNRMGLQRAGTTGLLFPKGAHQAKADYGLGGTGQSHDDVATVGAHTAESRPRALSILQIQRMRGKSGSGTPAMSTPAMGTPAKWDKEHADAPSPFLKRERAFR